MCIAHYIVVQEEKTQTQYTIPEQHKHVNTNISTHMSRCLEVVSTCEQ